MELRIVAFAALLVPLALPAQETARQSAPVVIANRTAIVLRGPIAGYSAVERARGAIERIEAALDADPDAGVSFGESEEGTRVRIGGRLAFIVTQIDIDPQAGETTMLVAREAARRLEQAIAERREQRSPGYLLIALASQVCSPTSTRLPWRKQTGHSYPTDCGLGERVHPQIAWAKLRVLH